MKKISIVLFLLLALNKVNAQTEILKDNGSWITLANKITISDKLFISNVYQQRRVGFLNNIQGFFLTPSLNYKLTKNISVGAGYIYYKGFPSGEGHAPIHWTENSLFQLVSVSSKAGKINLNQRFMFEERTIDLINKNVTPNKIEGNKHVNRFRYRLQASFNMFKLKNEKYVMGKLSNEIRTRFSDGTKNPDFDQNNFCALLGYKLLDNSSIWMGYGRYFYKMNSTKYIASNLLHVNLSYNIDLRKKK
jgi:hypothetical protein